MLHWHGVRVQRIRHLLCARVGDALIEDAGIRLAVRSKSEGEQKHQSSGAAVAGQREKEVEWTHSTKLRGKLQVKQMPTHYRLLNSVMPVTINHIMCKGAPNEALTNGGKTNEKKLMTSNPALKNAQ